MDRLGRMFVRLCLITTGFIVACLTAAIAMILLGQLLEPGEAAAILSNGPSLALTVATLGLASVIGAYSLLPTLVVVFYAEISRKTDWLFYALSAAIIGAVSVVFATSTGASPSGAFVAKLIASGIFGGLAFWIVAGRSAGSWLPSAVAENQAT